jgi:Holliday junction resolvasome RuvABC endonuclease subunit
MILRMAASDPGDACGFAVVELHGNELRVLLAEELALNTLAGQRRLNELMTQAAALGVVGFVMEEPKGGVIAKRFRMKGEAAAMAIGARIWIGQGQRRGELRARAIDRGIKVLPTIGTSEVKAAMAYGGADKAMMITAVQSRTGYVTTSDHVADAISVAAAGLRRAYLAALTSGKTPVPRPARRPVSPT